MTPEKAYSDLADRVAQGLTSAQRALVLAMPLYRAKKWRALYRHAKVRHWVQLPFSIARPTLTGSEYLTDFGALVRGSLERKRP